MTPQERQLIDELFDRLSRLEDQPRDPDAERAIAEGLARAPHAIYPLVQTVLVQDEALKAAEEHIRALGGDIEAPQQRGFLDTMRDALLGPDPQRRRGSVPEVRPSVWGPGAQAQQQQPVPDYGNRGGGSFLGAAAATAAGVIGGSLLFNSLRSMMGGDQAHARQSAFDDPSNKDSAGGSARDSDLAREAGLNEIGGGGDNRQGWFDRPQHIADSLDIDDDTGGDGGSDFGGGGDGGGGD